KSYKVVYLGIAIAPTEGKEEEFHVGITAHDGTYSIDYEIYHYHKEETAGFADKDSTGTSPAATLSQDLAKFVVDEVDKYRTLHSYKIIGGAVTEEANTLCPELRSQLWQKLDIVCFKFRPFSNHLDDKPTEATEITTKVDEESDSVVRKAIEQFGPNNMPRLMVKYRNQVLVDNDNQSELATLQDFERTVHPNTWKATMMYADSLKARKVKIAFFNSTPQGGGVALMRHALIRFLRRAGVDCKPKPEVFRITKNNHNILQGVDRETRLKEDEINILDEWCEQNAARYWTSGKDAPLKSRATGGADVIIVDDPQMPKLVDIAKRLDPDRPVIFRSHIQVRADLADEAGSSTAGVWNWIWENVQKCDVFVSHPVREFVPANVTPQKVGYMPATTDWLDGLNKEMSPWDLQYYMHEFFLETLKMGVDPQVQFKLEFADKHRPYIVQIARFDPAKGIPDVLASYAHFRSEYIQDWPTDKIPQLIIAGHGAIDDPDARIIYRQTMDAIRDTYSAYAPDIIVMRVGPSDQILNTLMTNAHVALQLSTREGFEVKVSEALHHGVPIIATRTGGIPLQIYDGRSGFLVESGDYKTVAKHLYTLFTDKPFYEGMRNFAVHNITDEVSTVGNALCWLYLADALSKGEKVKPHSGWINDMARLATVPYDDDKAIEVKIQRSAKLDVVKGASEQRARDEMAFKRRVSEPANSQEEEEGDRDDCLEM
ncbi:UDP-Glycosyltransferase/glycogen phosphorylase, partial [Ophiobolus disseminans]